MTPTQQTDKLNALLDEFHADLIALRDLALKDVTTQHGYGVVLRFLTPLRKTEQQFFLLGLIKVGYPASTVDSLRNILGLS